MNYLLKQKIFDLTGMDRIFRMENNMIPIRFYPEYPE
jgi:hypothetical protein